MYNYQQIIRVNGEQGARMYQMMPNSSALLLDDTAPLVWVAVTDGAGYKSLTPYEVKKYEPKPVPDMNSLIERLERLEKLYDKSDSSGNEQKQYRNTEHTKECKSESAL